MSFSNLLRKISYRRPAGSGNSPRASPGGLHERPQRRHTSEPTQARPTKRPSTTGGSNPPQTTSPPLLIPKVEHPAPDVEVPEVLVSMALPASPGVVLANLAKVPLPETIPAVVPVPDKLTEAWDAVKADPIVAITSRVLDSVDDVAATTLDLTAPLLPVVTATVTAAGQTDLGKSIKEGIDKLSEGMPILMRALDELKSIHPFIGVVVLAFQTVYTLEQKRRDNDKKIMSLFVAMRDMMRPLLLLNSMKSDDLIAPDGTHIEDRLKSLVERTADDIKICSNVCDAYTKKRLLAKVLLSPIWDAKLLDFVNLFGTRQIEFEFELTMHTSQGIDKANAKLDAVGEATKALSEQMDAMKAMFQQLVTPGQKQLSELVAAMGGLKVLKDNDKVLFELERTAENVSSTPKTEVGRARREQPKDTTLSAYDLRRDVLEDPIVSVEKNLDVFSRKFEAQKNQIVDELTFVVKRESDRVIHEVTGGPHERILDRSIHDIWKDMGWRGSVKARHFVLALRDHYLEKLASETGRIFGMGTAGITSSTDPDAWATKYIDIIHMQPILEAIDDDASGFITVGEINRFTSSRPIDWSLPHWLAFWAVGYRASIVDYAYKIEVLFAKMEGIRSEVLPLNLQSVVRYFTQVWEPVHTLIAAVLSLQPSQEYPGKFRSYIEAEETRLRNNLRAVDFIIDGTDTLALIIGVGRVEKTVFPVLYLLMEHHYEIMRVMRTKVVDSRELWEGVNSVTHVQEAISYRVGDLTNNFSQQKLDIEKHFQNFAYGMFRYFDDPKALWSGGYVRNLDPQVIPYDDTNEDPNIKPEDVLKFESSEEPSLDYWVYDGHSINGIPSDRDVESPLRDILGHWHGYFYEAGGAHESDGTDSMVTLVIEPTEGEQDFKANAWSVRGRFIITGSWSKGEDDIPQIKFKTAFPNAIWAPIFFSGHFDLERNALTGVWGYSSEPASSIGRMEFRRIPPCYLTVYPSIKDLSDNKSRSLWKFAIVAVRNDVRRKYCPWSYFAQRRDDRKAVVSLGTRYLYFGKPLSGEEIATHYRAVQGLTAADACFYGSIINRKRAYIPIHDGVYCDSCGGTMSGARLFCFDCVNKDGDTHDSVDLCCAPESRCIEARITHRENLNGPHEPNHRLIKFRTVVLTRELGPMYRLARTAFECVEELCEMIAGASQQPREEIDTGKDTQDASTSEPTTAEATSESAKPEGVPATADDTKDQPKAEPITVATEMPSESGKSDDVILTATDGAGDGTEAEPTVTKKPDDVPVAADSSKDEIETSDEVGNVSQSTTQPQPQDGGFPTCGKCNGSLTFPFWYCLFCEDNLFICDACDSEGVPDLSLNSGKHTMGHHLIRCLPPMKDAEAAPPETEYRLIAIESRLDGIQTRFDSLSGRIDDLTGRMGNIEQLLHSLVETSRYGAAQ